MSTGSRFTRRAFLGTAAGACGVLAQQAELPGTAPLVADGDLTELSMEGAHHFVERKIRESATTRQGHWKRDFASPAAYEQSVAGNRKRFLEKIGVVDARVAPHLESFGNGLESAMVSETASYRVHQVRWRVLEGVHAEGLQLEPKQPPVANVVALPDADDSPEQLAGLAGGLSDDAQLARALAECGCRVLVPVLLDRGTQFSGHAEIRQTDQTHREWIYRQAFHMGRHVIGYEVQKVLAAVDWLRSHGGALKIGVAGCGEGGLIAFYAAAADVRIDAALVSGYFQSREKVWAEPIYRNVWGLLEEFGDAEIATLMAPRPLVVSHGRYPEVQKQKGDLIPPDYAEVSAEFARIGKLIPEGFQQRRLVAGPAVVSEYLRLLTGRAIPRKVQPAPKDRRTPAEISSRQERQVRELENHVQGLVRKSEEVRSRFYLLKAAPQLKDEAWNTRQSFATLPPEPFASASEPFREQFWKEVMGKFDEPYANPHARSRKTRETEKWTGYEVAFDVWPEFTSWGALLVPKNMKPGERRPVVVCQHGRQGRPWDTVEGDNAYNRFAAKLADRGFIVFAPQNLYIFEDRYRWLSRKANGIKASLFSVTLGQHEQLLRWLGSLPFVDGKRIAFYGLSYGGESAMRLPAALKGYCLSVCSGDFNQWAWKVASTDERFSFMYTIEWEMPYFNMGNTFDYAEMAYLIFPRPFFVERGHNDRVGRDRWVAYEYAKVRYLYTQHGLADRTGIEFFNGGHAVRGEGAFEFLHKHLDWPSSPAR